MSEKYELSVNVGDLVYDDHQREKGLGVVVGLEEAVQVSLVLDSTGASGLRLAAAGTNKPVAKIGSIPIPEVAKALVEGSAVYRVLGEDFVLDALYAEAVKGPVTIIQ